MYYFSRAMFKMIPVYLLLKSDLYYCVGLPMQTNTVEYAATREASAPPRIVGYTVSYGRRLCIDVTQ